MRFTVVLAFRKVGHEVRGLVRSGEKAQRLARSAVHPVMAAPP